MEACSVSLAARHTPGPFEIQEYRDGVDDVYAIVSATSGRHVATIVYWDDSDEWAAQALADASLLAAAPRLLAALKELLAGIAEIPRGLPVEVYAAEQEAIAAVTAAEGQDHSNTRRP